MGTFTCWGGRILFEYVLESDYRGIDMITPFKTFLSNITYAMVTTGRASVVHLSASGLRRISQKILASDAGRCTFFQARRSKVAVLLLQPCRNARNRRSWQPPDAGCGTRTCKNTHDRLWPWHNVAFIITATDNGHKSTIEYRPVVSQITSIQKWNLMEPSPSIRVF